MQGTRLNLSDTEALYLMRLLQETEGEARPAELQPWNRRFHSKLRQSLELYVEEITKHGTAWKSTREARRARSSEDLLG